jgi:hypothetical protein
MITELAPKNSTVRRAFQMLMPDALMSISLPNRIFILSPASCSGRRAQILLRNGATFDLATRLRSGQGTSLGEVFSFLSGLYFRGKLAYASRFGRPAAEPNNVLVITAGNGLLPPSTPTSIADLHAFATIPIDTGESRYCEPLKRDALRLAKRLTNECQVILLGSIATPKYRDALAEALGERLYFPLDFVGRGDMSRGGLMLRCVDSGKELDYAPLLRAVYRGKRPAKLPPRSP